MNIEQKTKYRHPLLIESEQILLKMEKQHQIK